MPNGIDTEQKQEQYSLTGFVNDINRQYTEVLMEYNADNMFTNIYDYGVQRNATYQMNASYYYEYDGRGSVSEVAGQTGSVAVKYSYGANGETSAAYTTWVEEQQIKNPYRYNAERIDDIAGVPAFQYLRARYLDLYTGTFTTQDTYPGKLTEPLSQNLYLYAYGNAVNYTDPSGHMANAGSILPVVFDPRKYTMVTDDQQIIDTYLDQVIFDVNGKTLRDTCENWNYLKSMHDFYGFEIEESFIIQQTYDLMDQHTIFKVDHVFFAYMASLCDNYDGGKGLRWAITGDVPDQNSVKKMLSSWGMTENQIELLYNAINDQHVNEMTQKDFAHEMVALSIMTSPTNLPMSIVTGDDIDLLGSIKGDLYSGRGTDPYSRDITSDIDAYNVYKRLSSSDNVLDVLTEYNQEMSESPNDRYSEYVDHFGGKENLEKKLRKETWGTDYLWGIHWIQEEKYTPDEIDKKRMTVQENIDKVMDLF